MSELERPLVYHLFGRLSAVPDYAVTEEDTLEFMHSLQSETGRPGLLFDELTRQQLLIIGCSLPDWLTRFLIRITKGKRLWEAARGKTEVVVDKSIGDEPGLVYFLEHFSARTKVLPESPAEFVSELYERWAAAHRRSLEVPAVPDDDGGGPGEMEPGAIFISYASEDLAVVEAIKRDLERLGLDVWFDKDALRGGDAYETKIKRNIENCSCFVPIVSRQTLTPERRFFRIEWAQAQEVAKMVPSGQRFIVPVAIDDTDYGEQALPEPFRSLHWMRVPEGRATEELCTTLREIFRSYQKLLAGAR
jgi:hypothetical protein